MINKSSKFNEPFLLIPASIDKLWGGTRLLTEYSKKSNTKTLAESWECSTHPDGMSYVASGPYMNKSLKQIITEHSEILGKNLKEFNDLPVLIKFIDAEQDLSIQLHPGDDYAQKYENASNGKYEMWYVLDAKENSKLIFGVQHNITVEDIRQSIENNTITNYLKKLDVKKGDVFFVKPGTVHAIGAGVLLAEIQQNSNLTYRLYDYNRLDKDGNKRELHIEKALENISLSVSDDVRQPMRILKYMPGCACEFLCRCKYFIVERILINTYATNKSISIGANANSFIAYQCINGNGKINFGNTCLGINKGMCLFVPANSVEVYCDGSLEFLKIHC